MTETVRIWRALLILKEPTYFASREIGNLYETEPLIGNYALAYALGLCDSPYRREGPPRYKQDLEPLNQQGVYVTPATFLPEKLRYSVSQFNALSDSYYFRFDQNAIATEPGKRARAVNFPQSGRIRMLGLESQAVFYLIRKAVPPNQGVETAPELLLPDYIRLGKFDSKARVEWEALAIQSDQPESHDDRALNYLINAVDLPLATRASLRAYSVFNIPPAPLLSHCHLGGPFWHGKDRKGDSHYLPADMHFGVEVLP